MGHGLYNGTSAPWVMDCTMVYDVSKKDIFDRLHKHLGGFFGQQNYQKRKYYIIRLWELISKKAIFRIFTGIKIPKNRNFDGIL